MPTIKIPVSWIKNTIARRSAMLLLFPIIVVLYFAYAAIIGQIAWILAFTKGVVSLIISAPDQWRDTCEK